MISLLSLLHLYIAYGHCPVVEMEQWGLVTPGKWAELVTMAVRLILVVPVAALSVVPSPVEWSQVAWAVMQVLVWWWQEALAAVAIACTT